MHLADLIGQPDLLVGMETDSMVDYLRIHGVLSPETAASIRNAGSYAEQSKRLLAEIQQLSLEIPGEEPQFQGDLDDQPTHLRGSHAFGLFINALRHTGSHRLASLLDNERRIVPALKRVSRNSLTESMKRQDPEMTLRRYHSRTRHRGQIAVIIQVSAVKVSASHYGLTTSPNVPASPTQTNTMQHRGTGSPRVSESGESDASKPRLPVPDLINGQTMTGKKRPFRKPRRSNDPIEFRTDTATGTAYWIDLADLRETPAMYARSKALSDPMCCVPRCENGDSVDISSKKLSKKSKKKKAPKKKSSSGCFDCLCCLFTKRRKDKSSVYGPDVVYSSPPLKTVLELPISPAGDCPMGGSLRSKSQSDYEIMHQLSKQHQMTKSFQAPSPADTAPSPIGQPEPQENTLTPEEEEALRREMQAKADILNTKSELFYKRVHDQNSVEHESLLKYFEQSVGVLVLNSFYDEALVVVAICTQAVMLEALRLSQLDGSLVTDLERVMFSDPLFRALEVRCMKLSVDVDEEEYNQALTELKAS